MWINWIRPLFSISSIGSSQKIQTGKPHTTAHRATINFLCTRSWRGHSRDSWPDWPKGHSRPYDSEHRNELREREATTHLSTQKYLKYIYSICNLSLTTIVSFRTQSTHLQSSKCLFILGIRCSNSQNLGKSINRFCLCKVMKCRQLLQLKALFESPWFKYFYHNHKILWWKGREQTKQHVNLDQTIYLMQEPCESVSLDPTNHLTKYDSLQLECIRSYRCSSEPFN